MPQPAAGGVPPRPVAAASGPAAAQLLRDLQSQVKALQESLVAAEERAAAAETNAAAALGKSEATASEISGGDEAAAAAAFDRSSEIRGTAARAEQAKELRETVASLTGRLESSGREALSDKERLSAAVADAQAELAFEVDRRAALEREVAALRSTLFAQPQAVSSRQAEEDAARHLRRAETAEKELAGARANVVDLSASTRNLQGMLDAAEAKAAQEHARESADAQARAEAAGRAAAAEAARVHDGLRRRLQDAESRAASLAQELEAALRARQERSLQAARASEAVAAAEAIKVGFCRVRCGRQHTPDVSYRRLSSMSLSRSGNVPPSL